MPKQFFTERDIDDLYQRGTRSLTINNDVVLTELAYEKAQRLGVKVMSEHEKPPSAPVRPYISKNAPAVSASRVPSGGGMDVEVLKQRVRDAVKSRLGDQIAPHLLETIIQRVLNNIGEK